MQTKIVFSILFIFILTGCTQDPSSEPPTNKPNVELTKLAADHSIDQHVANQAKETLSKNEEITSINAVNTKKKLVIGIEVHHNERFKLKKLRKQFKQRIEKEFPKMDIDLTTDQKIVWELGDLEKKIQDDTISKKELEKKIKHLIKLMKEKT